MKNEPFSYLCATVIGSCDIDSSRRGKAYLEPWCKGISSFLVGKASRSSFLAVGVEGGGCPHWARLMSKDVLPLGGPHHLTGSSLSSSGKTGIAYLVLRGSFPIQTMTELVLGFKFYVNLRFILFFSPCAGPKDHISLNNHEKCS